MVDVAPSTASSRVPDETDFHDQLKKRVLKERPSSSNAPRAAVAAATKVLSKKKEMEELSESLTTQKVCDLILFHAKEIVYSFLDGI